MVTLRWKTGRSTEATDTTDAVVVQVSKLMLKSYRDLPAFLRDSLAIRRAVLDEPGTIGISLRAQPVRRTFWTLSAFDDEEALRRFMRSEIHRGVMQRYRGRMAGSHFHTWYTTDVGELPPSWADAVTRLEDEATNP